VAVTDANGVVQAAGGIVHRRDADGTWNVLLVHRPRYDDWTLPKGKADDGETPQDTARREVEEETGIRARLGSPAGETTYRDGRGRPKVVRYWLMEPEHEEPFAPNAEVDELRWCTREQAAAQLTYPHDRALLASVEEPS
jgi:8-oxo-dGTP pyrophosphatase MutT (NUDIX family)